MMSAKWIFTNALTFLRILLSVGLLMVVLIQPTASGQPLFWVTTLAVYISDFLDGKLARRWGCCSVFGARLDIAADLFYIMSNDIVLIWLRYMDAWILLLVLAEFAFFLMTSEVKTNRQKKSRVHFDKIGRIAAGYYYLMPGLFWGIHKWNGTMEETFALWVANLACCILTVIAMISRGGLCWSVSFPHKRGLPINKA